MSSTDIQQWGLRHNISPCFGARLVLERSRLHFLADRASFNGQFTEEQALRIDQAFLLMMKQLELMLSTGELNPRYPHCVTLHHNGLTCEADTLGSCGYVYLSIYPTRLST
ncbi:TPA: type IV toxin-antitoxin system YeeU family antitoxin [Klebsiella pneumoniae]|nr:type IV toxin-antitoxin system YeeU family antitoxin [Klebsiella pneumoniae]